MSRLALGTVQFGLPYGVANRSGQVAFAEARAILEHAAAAGVDTLDTAIGYGDSERRLGEIGVGRWRVVTKLPAVPDDCANVDAWVRTSVAGSLERLGVARLGGLLLHRPQQLLGPHGPALQRALAGLREQGTVDKVGVSIYDPAEFDALAPAFQPELVQAPLNVLDRRLLTSGWMRRLRDAGTEVHVRSIFLQGLLLMEAGDRPRSFERWSTLWSAWHGWLAGEGLTALQACVGFAMAQAEVDRVVVGVDSLAQLQQVLAAAAMAPVAPPPSLGTDDVDLINPSRWNPS